VSGVAVKNNLVLLSDRYMVLDVSDPANPRLKGYYHAAGAGARRVLWLDSLMYGCCYDGGVVILKYTGSDACAENRPALARPAQSVTVVPNPTSGRCEVRLPFNNKGPVVSSLFDAGGRLVRRFIDKEAGNERIDISDLNQGVYFLNVRTNAPNIRTIKIMLVK
jgi:hypothetical protein